MSAIRRPDDPSDRQGCGALDTVHHETGLAILHAGVLEQGVHHETGVGGHVGHHQPQLVVHFPCQRHALDHLVPAHHAGTKHIHRVALAALGVLFQPDVHIGSQAQPHRLGPNQGHITVDHPHLFQPADPPEDGAGRQAHLIRDLVKGGPAIGLQFAQDLPVELVECLHPPYCAVLMQAGQAERPKTQQS